MNMPICLNHIHSKRARLSHGFTLIEMMAVVAIVAILLSIAIPSFSGSIRRNTVEGYVDKLNASIRLARAEAQGMSKPIAICPTPGDSQGNTITCETSANSWASGWTVFVDDGGANPANASNGTWQTGEEIIQHFASSDSAAYRFYLLGLNTDGSVAGEQFNMVFTPRGQAGNFDGTRFQLSSSFAVACHQDDLNSAGPNVRGFSLERSGRVAMAQRQADGTISRKNIANNNANAAASSAALTCTNS